MLERAVLTTMAAVMLVACNDGIGTDPASPLRQPGAALRDATIMPRVDVYVSAHPDDWQLFAGDRFGASAIGAAEKIVVVYATAGDAGRGSAYWNAREAASKASVDTVLGSGTWACAPRSVNAHSIVRCARGKVVSYYMRLPDGNWGEGFGFGSMELLQAGRPTPAIDGSAVYQSWNDFTATLGSIIASEAGPMTGPYVQVNSPEYDRAINPGDHADHYATADAARAAVQGQPWDQAWWVGYSTQSLAANVSGAALDFKRAEFLQYSRSMDMAEFGHPWGDPIYHAWMARTYMRYVNHTPSTLPPAPSNLTASSTSSSVSLAWVDNASNESLFRVQRAPNASGSPGAWADLATTAANNAGYMDAAVTAGTTYWYRVRAESNAGASAFTAAVAATTQAAPSPPPTPGNFAGTAISDSRIDLSWTDVSNESSYQLQRAADVGGSPGAFSSLATLGANTIVYSNTGLLPNSRYWYRLTAINASGSSAAVAMSVVTRSAAASVDVYVAASLDEWQIFMGDRVFSSMQSAHRVVLIYATAGELGAGTAYWNKREEASRVSVDSLIGLGPWTCARRVFGVRSIQRCEKGKVVSYYMRTPDGFWGDGFGHGSLQRLEAGEPTAALDGSTTYSSWSDYTSTLGAIIAVEAGGLTGALATVSAPDYDANINPDDMPDSYSVGDAVRIAAQGQRWDQYYYVGRNSQTRPANVSGPALDAKIRAFRGHDRILLSAGYGTTWWEVQGWLPRTYYRFVPAR